jgi:hypothetical protein
LKIVSFIVLILLSMVGYSVGAVIRAGKSKELKPQLIDLVLLLAIWAGGIYSGLAFNLNKWLMVLIWLALSIIVGILAVTPRKLPKEMASQKESLVNKNPKKGSKNPFRKLWNQWQDFFTRVGSFQTRIGLAFFFFIVVTPIALVAKKASDPLGLKYRDNKSYWLAKPETDGDLEQSKRQF